MTGKQGLRQGPDEKPRCSWCTDDEVYRLYHDTEWGVPVNEDQRLFEKICLEGFQAGLSWLTILRKRDNFRAAFHNFELEKVAAMTDRDVDHLLKNSGIIRHRKKIESTLNNARRACDLRKECGSLAAYFWSYEEKAAAERPNTIDHDFLCVTTQTQTSVLLSKDLKARGWSFIGATTAYAFMQAMGLVNDHVEGCILRQPCLNARQTFSYPAKDT